MKRSLAALVLGGLIATAAPASAQVAWDAPLLMPPKAEPGFGLYLTEPYGGRLGFVGTWRASSRPHSMGFRIGVAEGWGRRFSASGGIDLSGSLTRASNEFPLDIDWVFGAGLGVGRYLDISFPLGISVGHTFEGDGVAFTPYLTPRVALDGRLGRGGEHLGMSLAIDIGLDLQFQPDWKVRFGGTFGDRRALALGIVL